MEGPSEENLICMKLERFSIIKNLDFGNIESSYFKIFNKRY